ncbi:MAG TPA: DUF4177 domain-containing protein [Herpetosiphonaceae bacterium]
MKQNLWSGARAERWEYHTEYIDVRGFFGPRIDQAALTALLNQAGTEGWELVNTIDVDRGHGATAHLMFLFKRRRPQPLE